MQSVNAVILVTLLSLAMYLWTSMRVATARARHNIVAPAVTGHPEFERAYRVQINTLEWLPLYLPSLWIFAYYWNGAVAAAAGLVWILGRFLYALAYVKDPKARAAGFGVQTLATAVLFFGAVGKAVEQIIVHGL
ncbi:MAPEG family protein [Caulobacter soli]|uniref:MAPEG family protein n=1 Tax=Caulobacter soli TaxID=2708539 RepID=UPI0013EC25E0|nr:MAPEG family protein [Caulobacter soli]